MHALTRRTAIKTFGISSLKNYNRAFRDRLSHSIARCPCKSPSRITMKIIFCGMISLFLLYGIVSAHDPKHDSSKSGGLKVLVYSNTGYYRHPDIPKINRWLVLLGHDNGFEVDVTEHWKDMRAEELSRYDVLVLNNANELDLVLPEEQRQAVEQWFTKGKKGIVGLHAALVRQTKWPWLHQLGGCDFNSDSDFLKAKITIDPAAKDHPAVKGQPAEFVYEADWTNHDRAVTGLPGFKVLMRVDETTYEPVRDYFKTRNGKPMGKDHPIAWTNEPASGGRFFYTEFAHDVRSLNTRFARQHILEGIRWAANAAKN